MSKALLTVMLLSVASCSDPSSTPVESSDLAAIKVPPRRPPTIIRTSPEKGRTDVALNVQPLVVFSEPVEASAKTLSSIQLLRGTDNVVGHVELSADGVSALFIPDKPLSSATAYSLLVVSGLRDLAGDALAETMVVDFTTSAAEPGAPPDEPGAPPAEPNPPSTELGFVGGFVISDHQCVLGARVTVVDGLRAGHFAVITNCDVWGYAGDEGYLFTDLPLGVPVTLRASADGYKTGEIRVIPSSASGGISLTTDIIITKN